MEHNLYQIETSLDMYCKNTSAFFAEQEVTSVDIWEGKQTVWFYTHDAECWDDDCVKLHSVRKRRLAEL